MALYGFDESKYQITIIPQDFGIFKATQGVDYVDPTCDEKYQAAKAAGKLLGVYHYANFGDPIAEANYFVDNCMGYIGEALLALDVEINTNVSWALAFLNQVYARTQVRPVIYMSASTATAVDWSPVSNDYALWCAGYPAKFDVSNPPTPLPDGSDMPFSTGAWSYATIWQYSSSAGTLDRDIAYMTSDAWGKFAEGDRQHVSSPAPTQEETPTTPVPDPVPTPPTTDTQTAPTTTGDTVAAEPVAAAPVQPEAPASGDQVDTTTPQVSPVPEPVEVAAPQTVDPQKAVVYIAPKVSWWKKLVKFLKGIFKHEKSA